MIANVGVMLLGAIIVDKDHATADVDVLTQSSIANIAQMTNLGIYANVGLLDHTEVADMNTLADLSLRTQMTVGANV